MNTVNFKAMDETEIDLVGGGSIDGEPGWQWLIPPSILPSPIPGEPPEVIPGVPLPPVL